MEAYQRKVLSMSKDSPSMAEPTTASLVDNVISGIDPRTGEPARIGVLTSGGDAPGMNAAVRAVVRTAVAAGAHPYAIYEGWIGAVEGGDKIRRMTWGDVSGILSEGGTVIGSARCAEFREYAGRTKAVLNLIENGIDRLIVIGGDGSLTGADMFRREWGQQVSELVAAGKLTEQQAADHPELTLVGLVGSIDNDLVGTNMTIGADSALDRITTAMDQISATAASHRRTFILEVMGRACGYLPLMAAVAGGADYVFTPENPAGHDWQERLCEHLRLGREAGRRESIVLVAEGAKDADGQELTTAMIAEAIYQRMGEKPHVTVLGHIQRGGTPSAYDRWMPTLLGYCAVEEVQSPAALGQACILGVQGNRVVRLQLEEAVKDTRAVAQMIADRDFESARKARGTTFYQMSQIFEILAEPPQLESRQERPRRVGILHAGGLAPGMNAAARAAVRMGIHRGWTMLGIDGSWKGLADGRIHELTWADVEGWAFDGGAELGTRRKVPPVESFYALGRSIERSEIDALIVIGGFNAYLAVRDLVAEIPRFPALNIPMVLIPASIDNNLPGTELSIGADSALNNATWALDRIRESAAASRRCFVAEAMGRKCGYLALMSGITTGAEYIYLNEVPLSLRSLSADTDKARASFEAGRRLLLVVMNEETSTHYDRKFISRVYESTGEGLFDVRDSALGYIQQGGSPTPFDRLLAARMVFHALGGLEEQFESGQRDAVYIGVGPGDISAHPMSDMEKQIDMSKRRPRDQWWLSFLPLVQPVSLENSDEPVRQVPIYAAE